MHEKAMSLPHTRQADVVVIGAGLAGICAAVAAARNGAKTLLIQDRPMPGGNSSSEIRMWICGAQDSDFREAGLLEELKLANYYYNPTLKYTLWDHVMRDFLEGEPNLECYFNTSVIDSTVDGGRISSVIAWGLTDYILYEFRGKVFVDCSGDSILAERSGAEYVHGREARKTYNEPWGLEQADGKTMGNSILMQLRRTDDDRPFKAPSWAYHYTDETVPRQELAQPGDNFWWLEFGGVFDTIKDAREIGRELTKIALGYWEYIKNHPDGRGNGWALDWLGSLPGKRESRRYVGDYVLTQDDTVNGRLFPDAIAYGAWLVDDHYPEAIYHKGEPNRVQPLRPGYHVPYRCLYSRNISNLLFAGRNISVSHLALSSVRVMGTCAMFGQAAGTAAALAVHYGCTPREIGRRHIRELQQRLVRQDQFIPGVKLEHGTAARNGTPSDPRLADGFDRETKSTTNHHSILLHQGESCQYTFKTPTTVTAIRLVWDSNFEDSKKMRFHEGCDESRQLPSTLAKAFIVETQTGGEWQMCFQVDDNFRRLNLIHFPPRQAQAIRLTLKRERIPGEPARLFSFEPIDELRLQ